MYTQTPDERIDALRTLRRSLNVFCITADQTLASSTTGQQLVEMVRSLKAYRDQITPFADLAAIAAKDEHFGPALDLQARIDGVTSAIDAAITLIANGFPSANGYILREQIAANGTVSDRQFTAQQVGPLRTAIGNIQTALF